MKNIKTLEPGTRQLFNVLNLTLLLTIFLNVSKTYAQEKELGLTRFGLEIGIGTTISGEYVDENYEKVETLMAPVSVHIGFLTKNKKNEFHLLFGKYIGLEYIFNMVGNKPRRVFPFIGVGGGMTFVGYPGQSIIAGGYDEDGIYHEEMVKEDGHISGYFKPRLGLNIYVSKKTLLQPCVSISQLGKSTRAEFSIPMFFTF